jgi:hypothetical protein
MTYLLPYVKSLSEFGIGIVSLAVVAVNVVFDLFAFREKR